MATQCKHGNFPDTCYECLDEHTRLYLAANAPRDCEHGQLARSCQICELMKELAAMTADKELAERERDVAKCDTALERTGRIYAESAKELAERQVAVLIKHASNHSSCFGCKVRDVHRVCQHSDASCFERFAAWSHKQASKQVTNA